MLVNPRPDDHSVDRISAGALTDALAHFAELDDWASVTLHDVAQHATLRTAAGSTPRAPAGRQRDWRPTT